MLRVLSFSVLFVVGVFVNQSLVNEAFTELRGESEEGADKHLPNDNFFFQRSFPNATFDSKAYQQALAEAQNSVVSRDLNLVSSVKWDVQGPGNIGGRVNCIAVHPKNNQVVYLGYSAGGIFKTIDGGKNWKPIFDEFAFLSIGDIKIDPTNPDVVYAGTGDPNISSNPFIGNGLYKSTDGGVTWKSVGLINVGIVSKIEINPLNSKIIYVGTMGSPFVRDNNRGLYKSVDGGLTWTKVLFLSTQAGIIDLVLNPLNPNIIYAAGWDRIRTNFESTTSGPNSRLYKSIDAGATWTTVAGGFPSTGICRIGLTMDPKRPEKIYAVVINTNFDLGGIYKTVDNGNSWTPIPTGEANSLPGDLMGSPGFGWYFGKIALNPNNTNELYVLGVETYKTNDDGSNWTNAAPNSLEVSIHVDNHALEFDASGNSYLGTDGGAYIFRNGELFWEDFENNPTTQFYKTAYNPHRPTQYYGGAQDNGTVTGNRATANSWERLFDGDGFHTEFHPTDPNRFYVEIQNGGIFTTFNGTDPNRVFSQKLTSGLDTSKKRNWSMPYILSHHNYERLYCGTSRLLKLDYVKNSNPFFQLNAWVALSPDLTDAKVINEARFHNITTIDESSLDSNLILVGTSDANLWRTKNGGKNWTKLSGIPERYITSVKISDANSNNMFVTLSGYKDNSTLPHILRSSNGGDNWVNIAGNLPNLAINDIEVIPNRGDSTLFVATDGGVYLTLNQGGSWQRVGSNMPFIPVFDLAYNTIMREVVAATFARSIYTFPLDSISVDNSGIANITGRVTLETGAQLKNVQVTLPAVDTVITDEFGAYNFWSISKNTFYNVVPHKEDTPYNGVSTSDLISIRKHILNIEFLDSPYKIIAADANNDHKITTADMVQLNKIILRKDTVFPNNKNWRFIPSNFVFTDKEFPLLDTFPETFKINNFTTNTAADFIGIKTGDVNNSAQLDFQQITTSDRQSAGLAMTSKAFTVQEIVTVPIMLDGKQILEGFQLEIAFKKHLQFLKVLPGVVDISADNFSLIADGQIVINWFNTVQETDQPLFYIQFVAERPGQLKEVFSLSRLYFTSELYTPTGPKAAVIRWQHDTLSVGSPYPSPFTSQISIPITSSAKQNAVLTLYRLDGTMVRSVARSVEKGIFPVTIDELDLTLPSGIYILQVKVADKIFVRKLVKS